jgi:hypothetical protein
LNHSSLDFEIRQLRRNQAVTHREWELIKCEYYARKYDPNQPRIPAGNVDGGQWTSEEGADIPSSARPTFYNAQRLAAQKAIEAGVAFFTWLSERNGRNSQAIITFNASEFKPDGRGELDLSDVKLLERDKVDAACPRLGEVQDRTDVAAEAVRGSGRYFPPAEFGTAVHTNLKMQIEALDDPNFRAEVSYVKNKEENYGRKDSIRIDVLENVGDGTVCVYDMKTGRRGLSVARTAEIATNIFKVFPGTQRFIVSEIRPGR